MPFIPILSALILNTYPHCVDKWKSAESPLFKGFFKAYLSTWPVDVLFLSTLILKILNWG